MLRSGLQLPPESLSHPLILSHEAGGEIGRQEEETSVLGSGR